MLVPEDSNLFKKALIGLLYEKRTLNLSMKICWWGIRRKFSSSSFLGDLLPDEVPWTPLTKPPWPLKEVEIFTNPPSLVSRSTLGNSTAALTGHVFSVYIIQASVSEGLNYSFGICRICKLFTHVFLSLLGLKCQVLSARQQENCIMHENTTRVIIFHIPYAADLLSLLDTSFWIWVLPFSAGFSDLQRCTN